MVDIPSDMKRRYTWRDRISPIKLAMWISCGTIIICWALGKAKPEWGLFTFFSHPIPILSDAAFFVATHVVVGVYMAEWAKDSLRWKNPALVTRNMRFSIDSRHGQTVFGSDVLIAVNALDSRKPGQTWAEGYVACDHTLVDPLDNDFWADMRVIPCRREQLSQTMFLYLRDKLTAPDDLPIWYGFPESYFTPDEKGEIKAIAVLNANQRNNMYQILDDKGSRIIEEAFDGLSHIVSRSVKAGRGGRSPPPPKLVQGAQEFAEGEE